MKGSLKRNVRHQLTDALRSMQVKVQPGNQCRSRMGYIGVRTDKGPESRKSV